MPKIKTKRAAAKRLKATGTGQAQARRRVEAPHLEAKSPKRKRHGRKPGLISKADEPRPQDASVPYL